MKIITIGGVDYFDSALKDAYINFLNKPSTNNGINRNMYFLKNSNTGRNQTTEFMNITRVIKKEKADIIVLPDLPPEFRTSYLLNGVIYNNEHSAQGGIKVFKCKNVVDNISVKQFYDIFTINPNVESVKDSDLNSIINNDLIIDGNNFDTIVGLYKINRPSASVLIKHCKGKESFPYLLYGVAKGLFDMEDVKCNNYCRVILPGLVQSYYSDFYKNLTMKGAKVLIDHPELKEVFYENVYSNIESLLSSKTTEVFQIDFSIKFNV